MISLSTQTHVFQAQAKFWFEDTKLIKKLSAPVYVPFHFRDGITLRISRLH